MNRDLAAAAFFAVVSLAFAAPALSELANWGILDWDMHLFHQAVPRITLVEYGEFPLWNPYNWSGVPMLANPESRFLAPTFLLTLAFGEVIAVKLEVVLFLWIGMFGAWKLALDSELETLGAIGCALLLMLNGWYAIHLAVGHLWALNIALLPWVLFFYRRGLGDLRYSLATSAALLWMFFSGGVYPLMMTGLLLALYSLLRVARAHGDWIAHARLFGFVSVQTLALSAVKLLPTAESLSKYPRTTAADGGYTLTSLANALFSRAQTLFDAWAARPLDFNGTQLHESLYIGLVAFALVVFGVTRSIRKHPEWTVLLFVFTWIALGTHAPVSLWSGVHALPGFDNMRVPERLGVVMLLFFSLLLGSGLDGVRDLVQRVAPDRAATAVTAALSLVVAADLFVVNAPVLADAFPIPPLEVERADEFVQKRSFSLYGPEGVVPPESPFLSSGSGLYPALLSNQGSTFGYRVLPARSRAESVDSDKYQGEVFVQQTTGLAKIEAWSPNRIRVSLAVDGPGFVVVNQNWDEGWKTVDGRPTRALADKLTVRVEPEDTEVELYYRPTSFVVGAAITGVAILLLVFVPFARGVRA
jgi:hypothetical protein